MSDKFLRRLFGYALRSGVEYQDGRVSKAPLLVFADADYEVGDGSCGLKEDGKQCNEPVIAYARTDALIDAHTRIRELEAKLAASAALRKAERVKALREAADCIGHITRAEDQDAIIALIEKETGQ